MPGKTHDGSRTMTVAEVSVVISRYLPEPHAGLLAGMLFGYRQSVSSKLYQGLVDSGTLHIIALSGTNITILTTLVFLVCSRLFARKTASVLAGLIIIGFIWFVGPSPSVVRAAIMGCLALFAGVTGRQSWALWALIVTACAMTAFSPRLVKDISFGLSVGATLGLILFAERPGDTAATPYGSPRQAFLHAVSSGLRVTLAAQVFTIPLTVIVFRRFSLIAPVSNLLIGWVLPPLTGIGMVFTILAFVIPPLATLLSYVLWVGLEYVIRVVSVTAGVPFSSVSW